MNNLSISVSCVDGSLQDFDYDTGKELIHGLISDDWAAPPTFLTITATTADGKRVRISIPYSHSADAHVTIE
jgi:hypothetical protein